MFTELLTQDELNLMKFGGKLGNMHAKKRMRFKAFLTVKQGFKCYYCKCAMTLEKPKNDRQQPHNSTFEHLHDVFDGGGKKIDEVSEIVAACYQCNAARGSQQSARAFKYYSQLFVNPFTLRRFINHPKVGWAGIIREFGKIPPEFN